MCVCVHVLFDWANFWWELDSYLGLSGPNPTICIRRMQSACNFIRRKKIFIVKVIDVKLNTFATADLTDFIEEKKKIRKERYSMYNNSILCRVTIVASSSERVKE